MPFRFVFGGWPLAVLPPLDEDDDELFLLEITAAGIAMMRIKTTTTKPMPTTQLAMVRY